MATEFFHHLYEWQLAVCKQCQVAVWPSHVKGHLQGKRHRVGGQVAKAVMEEVQTWPGLIHGSSEFAMPEGVIPPISELPLYRDGVQCQREPIQCRYVCRDVKSMKEHWRHVHQWAVQSRQGRTDAGNRATMQQRGEEAMRQVHCQRFFAQGPHSSYFKVGQLETASVEENYPDDSIESTLDEAWMRAKQGSDECQTNTISPDSSPRLLAIGNDGDQQDCGHLGAPIFRDCSTSLLLPPASSKLTKAVSQPGGAAIPREVEEPILEKHDNITATLESYCRGYAAGVHERVWDAMHPYWGSMSSIFRADPAVGSLPQPQTLTEYLEGRRNLSEEHPAYGVRVSDVCTDLDELEGRAKCFLSLEISNMPLGVTRQSLGIVRFLREDKLGVAETIRLPSHGERPQDRWWCVSYTGFRGLGGEIMASDQ